MRRVRKNFRDGVLQSVSTGDGSIESLMTLAGQHFGHQVGYELLIKSFLGTEVSNAVSYLRSEELIETVGKQWKTVSTLESSDIGIIALRRLKRVRGELKSAIRLSHAHGRTEEAVASARMLEIIESQIISEETVAEPVSSPKV